MPLRLARHVVCVASVLGGLMGCGPEPTPILHQDPFQNNPPGAAPLNEAPGVPTRRPNETGSLDPQRDPEQPSVKARTNVPSAREADPPPEHPSATERPPRVTVADASPARPAPAPPPVPREPVPAEPPVVAPRTGPSALVGMWPGQPTDWPQFRGRDGSGVSEERSLPVRFSLTENLAWKLRLKGLGASSPIVYGDRVLVTYYRGYGMEADSRASMRNLRRAVASINRYNGRIVWEHEVPQTEQEQSYQGFLALHGYASSTPAADGDRVVACFGNLGFVALPFDKSANKPFVPLWFRKLGSATHEWGSGASPVLFGEFVFVNAGVEGNSLVAMDRRNGNIVWKVRGPQNSWSTPAVVEAADGSPELVVSGEGELVGLEPGSGKQLWRCDGIPEYVCPSVTSAGGVVFVIGGRSGRALAVRAGGRGDVTSTHVVWRANKGANVPSPVVADGRLMWVNDQGVAVCLNAADGRVLAERRLDTGQVFASTVLADGKLYVVSRERGVFVLSADPEFRVLARNVFEGDETPFNATPAISEGQIFVRSDKYLYCIVAGGGENPPP